MLAFIDLIHALPTRGRKVGSFASREEKLGEMHLFRGSLHSCIHAFGSSFVLEF
jgi:hypothetical protein